MNILKERLDVIIIPNDKSHPIAHRMVPMVVLYGAFFISLVILGISIFLAQGSLSRAYQEIQLHRLIAENRLLKRQLSEFEQLVSKMEGEMAQLVEREKLLRIAANLPSIDDETREVGVGGPSYGSKNGMIFYDELSAQRSQDIDEKIHKLLRQAKLESQSLAQVCSTLAQMKDRLDHTPSIKPTMGYISSHYGMRLDPFTGRYAPHYGVDFTARIGTPVYATADGKVESITDDRRAYGLMLKIDHGYGFETVYAHLAEVKVSRGQKVKRDQLIALIGNTGRSTGPHLHYEVRKDGMPVNPRNYLLPEMVVVD